MSTLSSLSTTLEKCVLTKREDIESPCLSLLASLPAILFWLPSGEKAGSSIQKCFFSLLESEKELSSATAGIVAYETASMFHQLIAETQARQQKTEKVKKYDEQSETPAAPSTAKDYTIEWVFTWLFERMDSTSESLQLRYCEVLLRFLELVKERIGEHDLTVLLTLLSNQLKCNSRRSVSHVAKPSPMNRFVFETVVVDGVCAFLTESHISLAMTHIVSLLQSTQDETVLISVIKVLSKIIPILGEAVKTDWQEHFALLLPFLTSKNPALPVVAERCFLVLGTVDASLIESFLVRLSDEIRKRVETLQSTTMCEVCLIVRDNAQTDVISGLCRVAGHLLLLLFSKHQTVRPDVLATLLSHVHALFLLFITLTSAADRETRLIQQQTFHCCVEGGWFLLQGLVMAGANASSLSRLDDDWLLPELAGMLDLCNEHLEAVTRVLEQANNANGTSRRALLQSEEVTLALRRLLPLLETVYGAVEADEE